MHQRTRNFLVTMLIMFFIGVLSLTVDDMGYHRIKSTRHPIGAPVGLNGEQLGLYDGQLFITRPGFNQIFIISDVNLDVKRGYCGFVDLTLPEAPANYRPAVDYTQIELCRDLRGYKFRVISFRSELK